jgi:hypothetical protein
LTKTSFLPKLLIQKNVWQQLFILNFLIGKALPALSQKRLLLESVYVLKKQRETITT